MKKEGQGRTLLYPHFKIIARDCFVFVAFFECKFGVGFVNVVDL